MDECGDALSHEIHMAAVRGIGYVQPTNRKPWWNKQCTEARRARQSAYIALERGRGAFGGQPHSEARTRALIFQYELADEVYQRVIRLRKGRLKAQREASREQLWRYNQKRYWSLVGARSGGGHRQRIPAALHLPDGEIASTPDSRRQAWHDRFIGVDVTQPPVEPTMDEAVEAIHLECLNTMREEGATPVEEYFTAQELKAAIGRLQRDKAGGPDGLLNEFLKYGGGGT